jgi:GNAT superfamily N-acetyltransferase
MPDATPAMLQELFRVILTPYVDVSVLWKIHGCDGGAAWLPPEVAERFAEIEQTTRAGIHPLTGDGGVRYAAFWDWLGAHLPAEPCWFLDLVAVAPTAQGRGLGRALVMHGVERARADGCPAFLETGTPRNVPFYESLGFQIVGEQRAPDGGPLIWFMQTPRTPS